MQKDDWYRDRIVWRANKHKLFEKRCVDFSTLPKKDADFIIEQIGHRVDPIVFFYKNMGTWTILDTSDVYSFHGGKLVRQHLDDIQKQITMIGGKNESIRGFKTNINFLTLKKIGESIWAPEGEELFALWNILRMFPLKTPI